MPSRPAWIDRSRQILVQMSVDRARDVAGGIIAAAAGWVIQREAAVYDDPIRSPKVAGQFLDRDQCGIAHGTILHDAVFPSGNLCARVASSTNSTTGEVEYNLAGFSNFGSNDSGGIDGS